MNKPLLLTSSLFFSFSALATNVVTAKVVSAGVNSNNIVFVTLDTAIPEPGCSNSQLWIASDSPEKDKVLSVALSAFHSGSNINIKTNVCYKGHPSFTPSNTDLGWAHVIK